MRRVEFVSALGVLGGSCVDKAPNLSYKRGSTNNPIMGGTFIYKSTVKHCDTGTMLKLFKKLTPWPITVTRCCSSLASSAHLLTGRLTANAFPAPEG